MRGQVGPQRLQYGGTLHGSPPAPRPHTQLALRKCSSRRRGSWGRCRSDRCAKRSGFPDNAGLLSVSMQRTSCHKPHLPPWPARSSAHRALRSGAALRGASAPPVEARRRHGGKWDRCICCAPTVYDEAGRACAA
jgi:hypothetical protein